MSLIHRRALITGLLASVAAPSMARLAPDDGVALTTIAHPTGSGVAIFDINPNALLIYDGTGWVPFDEWQRRVINDVCGLAVDNLYRPYGEPSFPITTPRQIRT